MVDANSFSAVPDNDPDIDVFDPADWDHGSEDQYPHTNDRFGDFTHGTDASVQAIQEDLDWWPNWR